MEHLFDPRPEIRGHVVPRCSSAYNHAFASVHSRPTVAGEMFSTSPVSSMVSPPKNRSSTTRLLPSIDGSQPRENFVERQKVDIRRVGQHQRFVERNRPHAVT